MPGGNRPGENLSGQNRPGRRPIPDGVNRMNRPLSQRKPALFLRAVCLLFCFGWLFPGWLWAEEAAISGPDFSAGPASPPETIHLGYPAATGDLGLALAQKIFPLVFERAGKRVRISPIPGERSLIEANAGRLDGDGARFGSARIADHYPNLIQVQEPLLVSNTSVFSIGFSAEIRDWSDIAELSPRIVHIRGYKLVESRLSAMGLQQRAFRLADHGKALRFLAAGRADVLISTEASVRSHLNATEFRNAGIRRIGVLEKNPSYLFLHRHHAKLAERLAAVLREMKADGTYRRLFQEFNRDLRPEQLDGRWLPEEESSSGDVEPPPNRP